MSIGEIPNGVPGIYSLIRNANDFSDVLGMDYSWEPSQVTKEQAETLDHMISAGENSQMAIYAGFRCISNYIVSSGDKDNKNHDLEHSDCNDISWIIKHLTEELEAISTTISSLNYRYKLEHDFHSGSK